MPKTKNITLQPYPGFQMDFCQASDKEVFTGGEAGGGKSLLLVLEATRYIHEAYYSAIIFRRTFPQLEMLISEARQIYIPLGAKFNESKHNFVWPNGAIIKFRSLQYIKDVYNYQGHAYDYIGFDELPHFPLFAYLYLFSRLRGINPRIKRYMRSTGNPDGQFVAWVKHRFVDSLPPNCTRYFKRINDRDVEVPKDTPFCSARRFIPCIRNQNVALKEGDPEYEANLEMLPEATKRALKDGKWDVQDKLDQLVAGKWWEDSLNGKNEYVSDGLFTVGCDFGHTGVDLSVELLGEGNRPYRFRSWNITKTTEMAQILADTADSVHKGRLSLGVDCIGPGAGVGDDLETHHAEVARYMERCTHKDPLYAPRYKGEIEFDTLRSQMCWKLREDFRDGNIDMSAFMNKALKQDNLTELQKSEGYFDDFFMLSEEVMAITYRIFNGKLIVLPKSELKKPENLGRSPNYFDALVIWNWVRRHHQVEEPSIDDEYKVDGYMEKFMRPEFEEDDAQYHDRDGGDAGEYENDHF